MLAELLLAPPTALSVTLTTVRLAGVERAALAVAS